ncbi:hypothetical protein Tco_1320647, partial [Tanacetum coccineum]
GCMMRAKLEVNTARLKKLVLLAEVSNASRVSTASRITLPDSLFCCDPIWGCYKEEHPAPADSIPPPVHRVTVRIYVQAQTPISLPSDTEVARLLAIPTLPLLPLSPWSSPLPQIPSPPLPLIPLPLPQIPSPPLPPILSPLQALPPLPIQDTIYFPSTTIEYTTTLPILLPTPSPPLLLPSTDRRADVREVCLPPWKRLCISIGSRYEVGESSSASTATPTGGFRADYGFVATLDDEIRQDTNKIYGRLDDAQSERKLMTGQLNILRRDRPAHACTALLMERKRLGCVSIAGKDRSFASRGHHQTGTVRQGTDLDEVITGIGVSTARTAGTR